MGGGGHSFTAIRLVSYRLGSGQAISNSPNAPCIISHVREANVCRRSGCSRNSKSGSINPSVSALSLRAGTKFEGVRSPFPAVSFKFQSLLPQTPSVAPLRFPLFFIIWIRIVELLPTPDTSWVRKTLFPPDIYSLGWSPRLTPIGAPTLHWERAQKLDRASPLHPISMFGPFHSGLRCQSTGWWFFLERMELVRSIPMLDGQVKGSGTVFGSWLTSGQPLERSSACRLSRSPCYTLLPSRTRNVVRGYSPPNSFLIF